MSQFNPKKLNIEAIHAGQRYPDTRSAFLPSDVNEIIESLYGISLGVENSAKRAFILSTPGNLIDISAVNKNIYFPKGTTIYADGYRDYFVEDKYVAFDETVQLFKRGIVVYNKKTRTISIEDALKEGGFNSGSNYQFLYLFYFAYDSENNLVTDLPVEHLVNGEKQSSDRAIVKEPYNSGLAYIGIDTKSYEIAIPEGTGFGDIGFTWDETYNYGENVENEEGYLYDIAIVYDRTEKLIKSIPLYELYEHRNYAWLFTIRMDSDKFVYCDLEAPFYVDGVLFDGVSSVEIVQETGESTTAVMSQKASTESFVPQLPPKLSTTSVYVTTTEGNPSVVPIFYAGLNPNSGVCGKLANGRIDVRTVEGEYDATNRKYVDEGFVPKLQIAEGAGSFAYIADENNPTGKIQIQYGAPLPYTLPARDAGGIVIVGKPFGDKHAVNLGYANEHYVAKITHTTGEWVYITKADGVQGTRQISYQAVEGTIPVRTTNGAVIVGTPTHGTHALPLDFAKNNFAPLKTEYKLITWSTDVQGKTYNLEKDVKYLLVVDVDDVSDGELVYDECADGVRSVVNWGADFFTYEGYKNNFDEDEYYEGIVLKPKFKSEQVVFSIEHPPCYVGMDYVVVKQR